MSPNGKPARFILAALLLLPAARASAVKIERLQRFSASSGQASYLEVAAGSVLVRFKPGVSTAAAAAALGPSGFRLVNSYQRFNWSAVALPGGYSVPAGLAALKSFPQVESAAPNRVFKIKRSPNDIYAFSQYALAKVQAFGAWEYETGASSRVTVAVIDTGIDGSHPELSVKLANTASRAFNPDTGAPSDNQPPTPACNHATRAAGVAAAASDNSAGIAGMSWGAQLLSLKVFADSDCFSDCSDEAGYGSCSTTEHAIGAAVDDIIARHNTAAYGKIVVNMSLGSVGSCSDSAPYPLQTAVNSAISAGVLLFAAAGNDGIGFIDSPANCAGVYAVGATDIQDKIASFSNSDTLMLTKGLAAPGVELYTTDIGGRYAYATGTSFASPLTAGLAALVWSAKPSLTVPSQVFDVLKDSADDLGPAGPDRDYGYGRINAYKAMCRVVSCPSYTAGTRKASAYPNPFRPSAHRLVAFKTAPGFDTSGIEIKVYTSEGELVKKLTGLAWDGKNEAGLPVASGIYLFRLKTDSDAAVGKFALIR